MNRLWSSTTAEGEPCLPRQAVAVGRDVRVAVPGRQAGQVRRAVDAEGVEISKHGFRSKPARE
jgi:hypothetical protein